MPGSPAAVVLSTDVWAVFQEEDSDLMASVNGGKVERCLMTPIRRVDVCRILEDQFNEPALAVTGGDMRGGGAVGGVGFDIAPVRNHRCCQRDVPCSGGDQQEQAAATGAEPI